MNPITAAMRALERLAQSILRTLREMDDRVSSLEQRSRSEGK